MSEIKAAEYKRCGECGKREQVSPTVYGCDACGKVIGRELVANGKYHDHLQLTAHNHRRDAEGNDYRNYEFCSWACVFAKLPAIACDYFVSLPFLQYQDDSPAGQRAADFFAALAAAPSPVGRPGEDAP